MSSSDMMKSKTFAQTCNKLSQFLKEKRSLSEFSFPNLPFSSSSSTPPLQFNGGKEINGSMNNNTMSLLFEGDDYSNNEQIKSLDLFPLKSSSPSANISQDSTQHTPAKREFSGTEEKTKASASSSMTIFYGGKVAIFDDLPEDKAREIMSLASQGALNSRAQTPTPTPIPSASGNNGIMIGQPSQEVTTLQGHPGSSDLPIARRVSLHRFMQKRKHRISATAPYPLHNGSIEDYEKYNLMPSFDQPQDKDNTELKLFQ